MSGSLKTNHPFTIAVVDDDHSVCEALESLLRSIGFRTVTFTSARDFLGSPQLPSVACLILDVCMPEMNGIELQRHLLAAHPIPTIFITSFGDDRMEQQVTQMGAIGFLKKPFRDETLIDALNTALGI
jgi:FixJ family two-component response regulator